MNTFHARRYTSWRLSALVFLSFEVGIRWVFPQYSQLCDIYLFHGVSSLAALFIFFSPNFNDRMARNCLGGAIAIWTLGSIVTTWDAYHQTFMWPRFSDAAYFAFYPLLLVGILRSITYSQKVQAIELFDVLIITLGFTSVISSFFLSLNQHADTLAYFLSIFYPIGDSILLVSVISLLMGQRFTPRSMLVVAGIVCFAIADYAFLFQSQNGSYSFGSLVDTGWLLAFILIMESMWHRPKEHINSEKVTSIATLIAMVASSLLLVYSVLHPGELSTFTIIPALITIFLAFIRMAIALHQSREIHDERELARTDELTGLNNRRRFISSLENIKSTDICSLLLLDLDGFKHVNDSLGHEAGDSLLKEVATRFARQMPRGALLARLGGDEFGVIYYGDQQKSVELMAALHSALSYPIHLNGNDILLGVSIGRVENDGQGELMRRADEAMYAVKWQKSSVMAQTGQSPEVGMDSNSKVRL